MRRIGVCSWSLRPGTVEELVERVSATGVPAVQIALDPVRTGLMPLAELGRGLAEAGISILSGMMAMAGEDYSTLATIRATGGLVPDATWPANVAAAEANARLASALSIELVTFHAGFVPHDPADPARDRLIGRITTVASIFASHGVAIALETGQEDADTMLSLVRALDERVGVNFDPANMLLYGMGDPVLALNTLAPHVRQVHIKDAIASAAPGRWGEEVPVGAGEVDWPAFFATLRTRSIGVDLVIEREAGEDRIADIRSAADIVQTTTGTDE